ncbi:MAG: zeta toxin family protein [Pseudohongiellaceae bacterium]
MQELNKEEQRIRDKAIDYARKNKQKIAKSLTDKAIHPPEEYPVSVFMAGSPGAGKTEASKALLESLRDDDQLILRIDPDELREHFQDYTGHNSWLFQPATSLLVERIVDLALKRRQSFLLDGTLASYEVASKNITRCIGHKRFIQILYVYQRPALAWKFVQAREKIEGRRIRVDTFIEQYFAAREVVNRLKAEFGKALQVDLLLKDHDGSNKVYKDNVDRIDNYIPEKYSRAQLAKELTAF